MFFENKLFFKDRVRSCLHIPLNFGKVMTRNMAQIETAGVAAEKPVLLVDGNSLWGVDVLIAIHPPLHQGLEDGKEPLPGRGV